VLLSSWFARGPPPGRARRTPRGRFRLLGGRCVAGAVRHSRRGWRARRSDCVKPSSDHTPEPPCYTSSGSPSWSPQILSIVPDARRHDVIRRLRCCRPTRCCCGRHRLRHRRTAGAPRRAETTGAAFAAVATMSIASCGGSVAAGSSGTACLPGRPRWRRHRRCPRWRCLGRSWFRR